MTMSRKEEEGPVQPPLDLDTIADIEEGERRGIYHFNPPQRCDYCKCLLAEKKFFVDGRPPDEITWANMCENCFNVYGAGIGWGYGQLYMHQGDGMWLLAAGFRPEDPEE